jgi:hypothetical protein
MLTSLWPIGLGLFLCCPAETDPAGYLTPRPHGHGRAHRQRAVPYTPREGDLVFYDDHSQVWTALFAAAGTGPPTHMGIVVKKPGGTPAVLEAGPDDTLWVRLLDAGPRLRQFDRDFHGTVLVRRCQVRLTPEKSAALTAFALAQDGKRYAALRLLAQGTWFRARGPLEPWLARTHLDRGAWICSELAVAAGTVAGLFDPQVVRANATYPRDLVSDGRHDLRACWEPPARWGPGRTKARRPPERITAPRPPGARRSGAADRPPAPPPAAAGARPRPAAPGRPRRS